MSEGQFFTVDSRKLTAAECWRLSQNPITFALQMVLRTLRVRVSFHQVIAAHLKPVPVEHAPPWAEQAFSLGAGFEERGLTARMTYTLEMYGGKSRFGRVWVDGDNVVIAQMIALEGEGAVAHCTTRTLGPRWIHTTSAPPKLLPPPEVALQIVDGDAAAVLARHRERIRHANIERFEPSELAHEIATHHRVDAAFQMKRGVWVLATADEVKAARQPAAGAIPSAR
jgi:hypothetical protein